MFFCLLKFARSIENIKGAFSGLSQFLAIKNPLKIMKNDFYFTTKALFALKIFKFLSWFFGHVAKQLDQKDKVNFKFHDVTAWLTIVIHILPNILRSKGNQTMKFLLRNIFIEKSSTKCGGEFSPRPFYWKLKLSISLDQ